MDSAPRFDPETTSVCFHVVVRGRPVKSFVTRDWLVSRFGSDIPPGEAMVDLRNGRINGVLTIPPEFSRRIFAKNEPHIALIADNTDNIVTGTMVSSLNNLITAYNAPPTTERVPQKARLDVVEVYPYVPYIQYLLPGSIVMSIFMMVMIGGGIIFIDDKARGLHEGYLVTPVTKLELIAGFNLSGAIKAVLSGTVLMTLGSLIAGIRCPSGIRFR